MVYALIADDGCVYFNDAFGDFFGDGWGNEADLAIHQTVEPDGALGQQRQGGFLGGFRESIEQAPRGLFCGKFRVTGRAPFFQNVRNLLEGAGTDVYGADDEVVDDGICQHGLFVLGDAVVHYRPFAGQHTDGVAGQFGQVLLDEPGVLAGNGDFAAEAEVVAHEHACTDRQRGREGFIVGVAQAQDVGVIFGGFLAVGYTQQAEVAIAFLGERVRRFYDPHVQRGQSFFDPADEGVVGDGEPAIGRAGGFGFDDLFTGYRVSAAMEH